MRDFPSAPVLQLRPQLRQGTEFRPLADEDIDVFFQRIRIVLRRAHVLDVVPEPLECFLAVIEHNHAIP